MTKPKRTRPRGTPLPPPTRGKPSDTGSRKNGPKSGSHPTPLFDRISDKGGEAELRKEVKEDPVVGLQSGKTTESAADALTANTIGKTGDAGGTNRAEAVSATHAPEVVTRDAPADADPQAAVDGDGHEVAATIVSPRPGRFYSAASIDDLMCHLRTGLITSNSLLSKSSGPGNAGVHGVVLSCHDFVLKGAEDALLEVSLSGEEVARLKGSDPFLLNAPLPLSRLVRVHLSRDRDTPDEFVSRFIYPDCALSRSLVSTLRGSLPKHTKSTDALRVDIDALADTERSVVASESSDARVERFDRMLGAIALMRTAEYYFTASTGTFAETTRTLPDLLGLIIEGLPSRERGNVAAKGDADATAFRNILGLEMESGLLGALCTAIYEGKTIDEMLAKNLAGESYKQLKLPNKDNPLGNALALLFKKEDFKGAVDQLKTEQSWLPYLVLAFAYRFRLRDGNVINDLLPWIEQVFRSPDRACVALGVMGAYYGYSRLEKAIVLDLLDPSFRSLVGGRPPIKFGPFNNVERVAIEGCYRHCFQQRSTFTHMLESLPWFISSSVASSSVSARIETEHWDWLDSEMTTMRKISTEESRRQIVARLNNILKAVQKMSDDKLDGLWSWLIREEGR